jgi:cobalamin biosynthesis protein CobD/CbiB
MGMDASSVERSFNRENNDMKNLLLGLFGLLICMGGIYLVLLFWQDVVALFRAVIGGLIAMVGLVMMSIARDEQG